MKDIIKLCLSLGIICAVAGGALSFVNQKTSAPRQQAEEAERTAKLKLVLPSDAFDTKPDMLVDGVQFFRAVDGNEKLVAYAAEGVTNKGFGGELKVLVGFDPDGKILAVLVSKHNETPGIGTRVTDRKETRSLWDIICRTSEPNPFPPNEVLDSYNGKFLGRRMKDRHQAGTLIATTGATVSANSVMSVSGATISSNAVLSAVKSISKAWRIHFIGETKEDSDVSVENVQ